MSGSVGERIVLPLMYLLASLAGSCATAPPVAQPVATTIEGYEKIVEDQLGSLWYRQTRFYADGPFSRNGRNAICDTVGGRANPAA